MPKIINLGVEQQYRGVRTQIHKLGSCIVVYGPDGEEVTSSLGEAVMTALRSAFRCRACVLEATLVRDRADEEVGGAEGEAFFVASDCLWLDGRSLTDRTLRSRRQALQGLLKEDAQIVQLAPQETFNADEPPTGDAVAPLLEEARACGCDGLVFKHLDGVYEAGNVSTTWLTLQA